MRSIEDKGRRMCSSGGRWLVEATAVEVGGGADGSKLFK